MERQVTTHTILMNPTSSLFEHEFRKMYAPQVQKQCRG